MDCSVGFCGSNRSKVWYFEPTRLEDFDTNSIFKYYVNWKQTLTFLVNDSLENMTGRFMVITDRCRKYVDKYKISPEINGLRPMAKFLSVKARQNYVIHLRMEAYPWFSLISRWKIRNYTRMKYGRTAGKLNEIYWRAERAPYSHCLMICCKSVTWRFGSIYWNQAMEKRIEPHVLIAWRIDLI